jgi:hypothetical protein
MKKLNLILAAFLLTAVSMSLSAQHSGHSHSSHAKSEVSASTLPGEGERIKIDTKHYFIYSFGQKPAVGTVTITVKVYNSENKQVTPFNIYGDIDMPAMRGAHPSLNNEFAIKGNDYVLPAQIVMRGQWEILIRMKESGRDIFQGIILIRA